MTTETEDDPLPRARTVALVLHGIGDHSDVDIITEAAAGFRATVGNERPSSTSIVNVRFAADGSLLKALELKLDEQRHLVIPFVWSHRRLRLTQYSETSRPIPFAFLVHSLPALTSFLTSLPGTVLKGNALHQLWMLPAAALVWLGVLGVVATVVWVARWHVSNIAKRWLGSGLSAVDLFVLAGIPIFVGLVWYLVMFLLDFLGDVATYLASDHKRMALHRSITEAVQRVGERAATARIVVVGHSLGSVAVSHSLAKIERTSAAYGRVFLLTLGSPLGWMAKVFPSTIESPSQLAGQFRDLGMVSFWVNLWRDGDVIGKQLRPQGVRLFCEASLGEGPHQNYWRDQRLWECLGMLLEAARPDEAIRRWVPRPDTQARQANLKRLARVATCCRGIAPIMLLSLLGSALAIFTRYKEGLEALGLGWVSYGLLAGAIGLLFCLIAANGETRAAERRAQQDPKRFRRWVVVSSGLAILVVLLWVSVIVLTGIAGMRHSGGLREHLGFLRSGGPARTMRAECAQIVTDSGAFLIIPAHSSARSPGQVPIPWSTLTRICEDRGPGLKILVRIPAHS